MHESSAASTPTDRNPERRAYDIAEVAGQLGVSERYVWTLVRGNTPPLKSFRLGRLRKVASEDLDAFIADLREQERVARENAA